MGVNFKLGLLFILLLLSLAPSLSLSNEGVCSSNGFVWISDSDYPATYSFTNDAVGSIPSGWTTSGITDDSYVVLIDSFMGHHKVIKVVDDDSSAIPFLINTFPAKTHGSVEWYMFGSGLKGMASFLVDNGVSGFQVDVIMNETDFMCYSPSGWKPLLHGIDITKWHHVRTDFDTIQDKYYLYFDGKYAGYCDFHDASDGLTRVRLGGRSGAQTGFVSYYDAIGYSWDEDYHIGDNMHGGCCGDDLIDLRDGLISEWHFDEGSGSTAYDFINNNDGVLVNSPDWVAGKHGNALSFDSVDSSTVGSYVNLGDLDILDGVTKFSISMWVNHQEDTADNDMFVIGNHYSTSPFVLWRDESTTDHYAFVVNDGSDYVIKYSNFVPTTNSWTHIVLTFEGGNQVRLFINGVEDANSPFDISLVDKIKDDTGDNYYIGYGESANQDFDGYIDEVRIYNRVLTPREIEYLYEMNPYSYINYTDNFSNQSAWCVNNNFVNNLDKSSSACESKGYNFIFNDWWNNNWLYRKNITISNSGSALNDYQVNVNPQTYNTSGLVLSYHFSDEQSIIKDYSGHNNYGNLYGSTVGLWHFDEGSGSSIYDSTAYGDDGSLSGAVFVNGMSGSAVSTDGSSTYASIPDSDNYDFVTDQSFTVSFWVKPGTGNVDEDAIVEKWAGSGGYPFCFRYRATEGINFVRWDGTNGGSVKGTYSLTNDEWYHVVGVLNASSNKMYLYINGNLISNGTDSTSGTTTNDAPIYIGARGGSSNLFNGTVDELVIFNKSLTSNEVKNLFYSQRAKFMEFKEGYNNKGKGLALNDNRSFVSVPDSNSLNLSSSFTVSLWFKLLSDGTAGKSYWTLINKNPTDLGYNDPFHLFILSSNYDFYARFANGTDSYEIYSGVHVNDGKWHLGTLVFDDDNNIYKLYFDGVLVNSQSVSDTWIPTTNTGSLTIGYWPAYNDFFNGLIDEVLIYNRSLSANEIRDLYEERKGRLDYADLRFINSSGSELPYWLEFDNSVWVKDSFIPSGDSNITMYYGNPYAVSKSDGKLTFELFDDFNNYPSNDNWELSTHGDGGSYWWTDGFIHLKSTNSQTGSASIKSVNEFTNNFTVNWVRHDSEQHYNDFCFGYGNIVGGVGGSDWWHTVVDYGYCDEIQDNVNYLYVAWYPGGYVYPDRDIDGPDSGDWHSFKNSYVSDGSWDWYNGTAKVWDLLGSGAVNDTYVNDDKYLLFSRGGYSGAATGGESIIDLIFVNKYVSSNPTITVGSEESFFNGLPIAYYSFDNDFDNKTINDVGLSNGSLYGNTIGLWHFDNPYYSPRDSTSYSNNGLLHGETIGLWHFDEGSGTTINDETLNNNDGTINSATWVNGIIGDALSFDGSTSYVSIADSDDFSFTDGSGNDRSFSISVWVKPSSTADQWLINKRDNSGGDEWQLEVYSGELQFLCFSGGTNTNYLKAAISNPLILNEWNHIVVTYDGSETAGGLRVFLNGYLLSTTNSVTGTYTGMSNGPASIIIGRAGWGGYYFNGVIDELAVYNKTLTFSEVKELYNYEKARFTEYVINESSGSAISFDGVDDYVNVSGDFNFDNKMSISLWVKPFDLGDGNGTVISKGYTGTPSSTPWMFYLSSSTNIKFYAANSGGTYAAVGFGDDLSNNNWYHLVGVYNGTDLITYKNGVKVGSAQLTGPLLSNDDNVLVGYKWGSKYFKGLIDEVALYNQSLTDEQVSYLYNNQRADFVERVGGKIGEAISFDGVDDYINISDNNELLNNISISAWINPSSVQTSPVSGRVMIIGYPDTNRFRLWFETSTNSVYAEARDSGNNYPLTSKIVIPTNEWSFIVAEYNQSNIIIFVNGSKYVSSANNLPLISGNSKLTIGMHPGNGDRYFNGTIDDVRIYNKTLSQEEVNELYNYYLNSGCCGDDYNESFYNDSLSTTSYSCKNSVYYYEPLDVNDSACTAWGYDWLSGTVTGFNGSCCGDDSSERFFNDSLGTTSYSCKNSVFYTDALDVNENVCNAWNFNWVNNGIGTNSSCCGDDVGEDFNNGTTICFDKGVVNDFDSLFSFDWFGDLLNFTSAKNACESKGYAWLLSNKSLTLNNDYYNTSINVVYPSSYGDVDGDGDYDLIIVDFFNSVFYTLINNGTAGFSLDASYSIGSEGAGSVIGDVDGDGDLDVIVASRGSNIISVYFNDGTGSFSGRTDYTTSSSPRTLSLGDVDGDGDLDIIVASGGGIQYWVNNGSGVFSLKSTISSYSSNVVVVGDVDGDGDLDVVASTSSGVYWFSNPLWSENLITSISDSYGLSLGDVDGDGDLDVVVSSSGGDKVSLFVNPSWTETIIDSIDGPQEVSLGDVDGDGDLDVVTESYYQNYFSVYYYNSGSFYGVDYSLSHSSPIVSFVDDFDGDNDLDVLSVFINGVDSFINTGLSGVNGPCCGDDGVSDDFYNDSSIGLTSYSCKDGVYYYGFLDVNDSACTAWGYDWIAGTVTGVNGKCCGDDISESFYNDTLSSTSYSCKDGVYYYEPLDVNDSACVAWGYDWLPNPEPNIYYNFNENSGSYSYNLFGDEYAYLLAGATWDTGKYGTGVKFVSGSYALIYDQANNGRVISLWFKPLSDINSSLSTTQALIGRQTYYHTNEFALYFAQSDWSYPGHLMFLNKIGSTSYEIYSDNDSWNAGQWYHVVAVIDDNDGMSMYINGVKQQSTNPSTSAIASISDYVRIGNWGTLRYFNGVIDDVRIYNSSLTEWQINNLYLASPHINCCGDDIGEDFSNETNVCCCNGELINFGDKCDIDGDGYAESVCGQKLSSSSNYPIINLSSSVLLPSNSLTINISSDVYPEVLLTNPKLITTKLSITSCGSNCYSTTINPDLPGYYHLRVFNGLTNYSMFVVENSSLVWSNPWADNDGNQFRYKKDIIINNTVNSNRINQLFFVNLSFNQSPYCEDVNSDGLLGSGDKLGLKLVNDLPNGDLLEVPLSIINFNCTNNNLTTATIVFSINVPSMNASPFSSTGNKYSLYYGPFDYVYPYYAGPQLVDGFNRFINNSVMKIEYSLTSNITQTLFNHLGSDSELQIAGDVIISPIEYFDGSSVYTLESDSINSYKAISYPSLAYYALNGTLNSQPVSFNQSLGSSYYLLFNTSINTSSLSLQWLKDFEINLNKDYFTSVVINDSGTISDIDINSTKVLTGETNPSWFVIYNNESGEAVSLIYINDSYGDFALWNWSYEPSGSNAVFKYYPIYSSSTQTVSGVYSRNYALMAFNYSLLSYDIVSEVYSWLHTPLNYSILTTNVSFDITNYTYDEYVDRSDELITINATIYSNNQDVSKLHTDIYDSAGNKSLGEEYDCNKTSEFIYDCKAVINSSIFSCGDYTASIYGVGVSGNTTRVNFTFRIDELIGSFSVPNSTMIGTTNQLIVSYHHCSDNNTPISVVVSRDNDTLFNGVVNGAKIISFTNPLSTGETIFWFNASDGHFTRNDLFISRIVRSDYSFNNHKIYFSRGRSGYRANFLSITNPSNRVMNYRAVITSDGLTTRFSDNGGNSISVTLEPYSSRALFIDTFPTILGDYRVRATIASSVSGDEGADYFDVVVRSYYSNRFFSYVLVPSSDWFSIIIIILLATLLLINSKQSF